MSKIEYENLIAFHPGYYIKDIIEDMEISQEEFAKRLGVTGKTLSNLVNGKINLSDEVALQLSMMLGTDVRTWLNLQQTYEEKCLEIEKQKRLDNEIHLMKLLDYKYFVKLGVVPEVKNSIEKVTNLCACLKISSLSILLDKDFLVNYRTGIAVMEEKNMISSRAWLQVAFNEGKKIETKPFNAKSLKKYIPEIRGMTVKQPTEFLPHLKEIFKECGISFVLLPSLRNSGINGAVKWINHDKVILAMNDRRNYADTFWFSLFHEIKHVLQQKIKITIVSENKNKDLYEAFDKALEKEADLFAQNTLIPANEYDKFIELDNFSEEALKRFSKEINIHPGVVVGRLQNDKYLGYDKYHYLKEKYTIQ